MTADLFPMLRDIADFLPLSEQLATAGQPTAEQLALIKNAGFDTVINLAWPSSPEALQDEDVIVDELGMEYVALPVRWLQPTATDLRAFFAAMDAHKDKRLFVHCIANKRVSAFLYLYRVLKEGMPEAEAQSDMLRIWTPNDVWQPFLKTILSDPTVL